MRDAMLKIVRQTFETYVSKGDIFQIPYSLPAELQKPGNGVFVAAFERLGRRPRGRVGQMTPSKPTLAAEIQAQTIALAKTYSFRKQDLPFLAFELLIAQTARLLTDLNNLKPDDGLLIRTDTGKTLYSLPSFVKKTPAERFKQTCAKEGIDGTIANVRIYQFAIDKFNE